MPGQRRERFVHECRISKLDCDGSRKWVTRLSRLIGIRVSVETWLVRLDVIKRTVSTYPKISPAKRRHFLLLVNILMVLALLTSARHSDAYPWMIRHEYTGCATCHTDPSGGFLLTRYGRAQTQALLSSFGRGPEGNEVDSRSEFAFGVPLPEWLNLGFSQRNLLSHTVRSDAPSSSRHVWMQSDLRAGVAFGAFEAAGSIGFVPEGAQAAALTSRSTNNLVAREFWLSYALDEDRNNRLRVGRMYLPFGIRVADHYFYVRNATQTDIDSHQQYGAAFFRQTDQYRFELMGVLGNYQLRPDAYRQRGYAAYLEYNVASRLGVGVSSLLLYQSISMNPRLPGASLRGAHGPFLRWAPSSSVAVMSEWDLLHEGAASGAVPWLGFAGMVQLDWEFVRGLHASVTPELHSADMAAGANALGYRGWLTATWFPYPHLDLRADVVRARDVYGPARVDYTLLLAQVHVSI